MVVPSENMFRLRPDAAIISFICKVDPMDGIAINCTKVKVSMTEKR